MKIQFTLPTAFLAMTFIGIASGVIAFVTHGDHGFDPDHLLALLLILSPVWIIIAFVAYSFGRRKLTTLQLVAFVVVEVIATVYFYISTTAV